MTPEDKLNSLFATARPVERDFTFEAEVAEKVAGRRAFATVGALTPWAIAATAVLWGMRPVFGPLGDGLVPVVEPVGMTLTGAAVIAGVAVWLSAKISRA